MIEFVSAWLQGLKQYDQDTYWHSVRTAEYFVQFMDYLGICKPKTKYIYASAALHDIGKLVVPQHVLQKRGRLSCREYRNVKKHPQIAFAWMSFLREPDEFVSIPYLHHERWNGTGYPLGLRGTEIPYHVRIFSVVDVWEAMSVNRPYRNALPQGAILGYIARSANVLFDPGVVDAFLRWRKKTYGDCWTKLVYPTEQKTWDVLDRVGRRTTPY
jgi:HD-GYP domain-containing protein (c-di-GMP phosphodiesterase class II)